MTLAVAAMNDADPRAFYDELAGDYDLMFEDWEASMHRQGDALALLLEGALPGLARRSVLDVAAGIGTQSLPLAQRGFEVCSRDLSSVAIARLAREARARGLSIDVGTADMRRLHESAPGPFDALIALDNAVPHLLTDADILSAFRAFYGAIRPGGVCAISVRDYQTVSRGKDSVHTYGVRLRATSRCVPLQAWHWVGEDHYDVTFYVIKDGDGAPTLRSATTRYYAVSVERLLALFAEAGFSHCERRDDVSYQPILLARRPA